MKNNILNPKVDNYLIEGCGRCPHFQTPQCKVNTWRQELVELRKIVIESGLTEEYKWFQPCYTYQGKNVLIVTAFKDYACISFFKGSLLKDPDKILVEPGKNSQAARQIRITSVEQVFEMTSSIKAYIKQAIDIEKLGKKVAFKAKQSLKYPEELEHIFENQPLFKAAFEGLTPGRQRGYILYFSDANQSKTRITRIEKYMQKIMEGKGIQD